MGYQQSRSVWSHLSVASAAAWIAVFAMGMSGGCGGDVIGIDEDPIKAARAICAQEGEPSYESDIESIFDRLDPDAVAYCEQEGCLGRDEAICLARLTGISDGSTGVKATLVLLVPGAFVDLQGNPVEFDGPVGPRWKVWNVLEESGDGTGRQGELVIVDALSGEDEGLQGWLTSH